MNSETQNKKTMVQWSTSTTSRDYTPTLHPCTRCYRGVLTVTPHRQHQHLNKLRPSPADLMALALAFLLPSGRALAFSIGWQMERAWIAADDIGTFCNCFRWSSNHNRSITFNVQSGLLLPADSLEKTPRACVLSIHLIFIPPSLKIDRTALLFFLHHLNLLRLDVFPQASDLKFFGVYREKCRLNKSIANT